ncbi:MAG: hypothetical protein RI988_3114 [Pseudomonadota bacterium]
MLHTLRACVALSLASLAVTALAQTQAPAPAAPATAAAAPSAHLARNLAATCANCHGTNGQARGDMKPLAGVAADKLIAMMADYKAGNQPATIMHQIAKGYTDEQIRLIAGYFAAQQPKK